ncbi:SRPBCC family protein [Arenimonas composti]|uniref:ATPase n=1 Tax=Arenimonas composti TR7-09 = DSM 18010 TaxID=1121013 RepID=A0A091BFC7_9GAMM|nr:ATPase [Arenimonas composti]KFN49494.1 hypothetical protein P873_11005 [Arenimonas composti TR7-09 = DSM 18010]
MPDTRRLKYTTTIAAPVPTVWRLMLAHESYRRWTAPFAEGSDFVGTWEEGSRIVFTGPSGDGMVAEIAVNREHEYISIRHLGVIQDGVEDTTSDAVRAWAPAYENYRFTAVPEGTRLDVELDVSDEWAAHMDAAWPKALAVLKALSEAESAAH